MDLLIKMSLDMFAADPKFKIHAYAQSSELWPIADPNDMPYDSAVLKQYFVKVETNCSNTTISGIIRVVSSYTHVEWRKQLLPCLNRMNGKITQHKLESLQVKCIRILVKKHPDLMHLNFFTDYLGNILPEETSAFKIKCISPCIHAGFGEAIQTSKSTEFLHGKRRCLQHGCRPDGEIPNQHK